ncbi:hypothetical protein AUK04_02435 [Candidatus Roizmanbacteria bacterium CG2_30_33_16]|uniref:Yip1 domain-containing protein n=4 Tax=Candidatus Roizmaniibacteriota TaxID=1752723 RepID=A0A2H0C521_9BACT|nr:MAG: hypothetical protein AUK04_02435 [Candidatus Roizmanbacteria bacterium CG2_30_33_16]PIP64418.1 MAG: hypothetical protein COW96_02640 [Candidatus Roizmanbacteria bacterium CG22_combo_CG10-13_8_21_14_all_33_16]PIX74570.1 MAG: hypothetical protein COZ39_00200 [Candidatus Roizmanbacteria bacterium CG_4_10_14_3_um_filter_33_21]PJB88152.1 MAG: hypothetical protein CO083_03230 [Candidatus Roizmanbacteria bacterium CG_4_9_14_0_8_um_filter_34_12]
MDFSQYIISFFTSLLIVVRRFIFLIFLPYKTIRKISLENDWLQAIIILFSILIYFTVSNKLRVLYYSPFIIYLVFVINFIISTCFFYYGAKILKSKVNWQSFVMTFSYSLFPTLIWFITSSGLYYVLPPPRTLSILGKSFSILFIAFSISLLCWKIILMYLSVRFSGRLNFYRTIYLILLYLCWFIPYSLLLYNMKLFRIPFI